MIFLGAFGLFLGALMVLAILDLLGVWGDLGEGFSASSVSGWEIERGKREEDLDG
jgi:hypothetical protein